MSRDGESVTGGLLLGGRCDENVLPWWPALPCHTRKSRGLDTCGRPGRALWITWWPAWPCSVDYMMVKPTPPTSWEPLLCLPPFAAFCSMLQIFTYTVIGPTLLGSWLLWASLPLFTWWSDPPPPSSWGVVGIFVLVVYRMIRPTSTEFLRCWGFALVVYVVIRPTPTYFLRWCGHLYLCCLHGDRTYPHLVLEVMWALLPFWFTWWSDSDPPPPASWGAVGIATFVIYMVMRSTPSEFLRCCGHRYHCGLHGDQIYPHWVLEMLWASVPFWFTWWSDPSPLSSLGAVDIFTFVVYMVIRSTPTYFLRCCGHRYLCGLHH